jgi:DNA-binding beta-propeller fold protein YncE
MGPLRQGSGDFDKPVAITTDAEGFVYVADNGNGLVQKFSEKGTFVLQWSVRGVIGVAADKSGHVYALSSFLNLVSKRSTAGVSEGSWQAFKLSTFDGFVDNAAQSIATDASGNVYVGDAQTVHWAPCHDGWPAPPEHTTEI